MSAPDQLYAQCGGGDFIEAWFERFGEEVASENELSWVRRHRQFDKWMTRVREEVSSTLGGPRGRRGRRAKLAVQFDASQFEAMQAATRRTLAALDIPETIKGDTEAAIERAVLQLAAGRPKEEDGMKEDMSSNGARDAQGVPDGRITAMIGALDAISSGDFSRRVDVQGGDEVAELAMKINGVIDSYKDTVSTVSSTTHRMESMTSSVGTATQEMSATVESSSTEAQEAAAGARQVHNNVQTVAAAAEEMAIGVREIAKNASEAARVATGAVQMAHNTNETISKLGDSSTEIGKVIKVITSIAQQTNLLALNATIEAARAGEAGKGFAVVANEVKELAKETAKATEDISQKIEKIQNDTKGAVDAIGEISNIINQINDYQSSIASAVEEQTATTNEISRSVTEAARGSESIAGNVEKVAASTRGSTKAIDSVRQSTTELSGVAESLSRLTARFRL
ncbi:MAG: methyl-accepting chemotaxis protein [Myxococcota bacterium]